MLKVIGSVTSPYTRLIRVVCEELHLPFSFEITAPFGKLDSAQDALIGAQNPLLKVPVLIDGDTTIIDSKVIIKYLIELSAESYDLRMPYPQSWREENLMSIIYGALDAGILRFIFSVSYPEIDMNRGYMMRSSDRIARSLQWLDSQASFGENFGISEAALICALDWFEKRKIIDWKSYLHLAEIHNTFSNRDSFRNTGIPADA